ncbi:spermidine/putrescine ABC transporter substrate-binding protein, partial [Candidatus Saccharibacteria bacterium]|nr:spermidine/putrescine ABC transporter substrate-binding protein [Candidatus Saccharibacteria bacterium]
MKKTFLIVCIVSAFLFSVMGSAYAAETLSLLTWKGYAPKNLV